MWYLKPATDGVWLPGQIKAVIQGANGCVSYAINQLHFGCLIVVQRCVLKRKNPVHCKRPEYYSDIHYGDVFMASLTSDTPAIEVTMIGGDGVRGLMFVQWLTIATVTLKNELMQIRFYSQYH